MSSTESYKSFIYSKMFIEHHWRPKPVLDARDKTVTKTDTCPALLEHRSFFIFFIDKRTNKDNSYAYRIFS